MAETKVIELRLDMQNERDRKTYSDIKRFAKKHSIADEHDALKAFIVHMHFLAVDVDTIAGKIRDLHDES